MKPKQSKCRSCGAPIYWAITEADKRMPVDVDKVDNGNVELAIDARTGTIKARVVEPGPGRRLSHFVTCPNAGAHRKDH